MISGIALAVGTAVIVWYSRRSLLHPRSHGFARFFAFEAIFVLIVRNAPYWFVRPLAPRQLGSWLLLIISVVLVVWGLVLLHHRGGPRPVTDGSPMFAWEHTETLVTTGIFRYIRHPMYASLLYLTWGALLKSVSVGALALASVATVALAATARVEETENVARFGQSYRDYMEHTRRFVPWVW